MKKQSGGKRAVLALVEITPDAAELVFYDMERVPDSNPGTWTTFSKYTSKKYTSKDFTDFRLSKDQYAEMGENIVIRLLALEGFLK